MFTIWNLCIPIWRSQYSKVTYYNPPAHEVPDDISMAHQYVIRVLVLAFLGPVKIFPECCFYPSTILKELLEIIIKNKIIILCQILYNFKTLRKSTLIDLMERNANHIIPSYCYLPVSCRSLVDRCGSSGSCKPQIF